MREAHKMEYGSLDDRLDPNKTKFVEYSILWIEPNHEASLITKKELVAEPITDEQFVSQKTSEFQRNLKSGMTLPYKWKKGNHPSGDFGYLPNNKTPESFSRLPDSKVEFLRVFTNVISSKAQELE